MPLQNQPIKKRWRGPMPSLCWSARRARSKARAIALWTALVAASLGPSAMAGEIPPAVRIATIAAQGIDASSQIRGNVLSTRVIREGLLAQELAARGIRLAWVPISGELGPLTNEAFAARRIDFANIGDLPSIILNARGVHTRLIVPNGRGSNLYLVVPVDSPARSLRDLKGKRISVQLSRPWELGFRELARENGMSFSDFKIFNLTPQVSTNALALGNIDALFSTTGNLIEERKLGRIIWTSRGDLAHKVRSSELWATQDFIEKYPDVTQLVATAYVRAQYWVAQEQNRQAAIEEAALSGTPESVARRNYDDPAVAWRDNWTPVFDSFLVDYYQRAARFAYDTGLIARPLKVEDLLDPRFVQLALEQLELQQFWQPIRPGQTRRSQ